MSCPSRGDCTFPPIVETLYIAVGFDKIQEAFAGERMLINHSLFSASVDISVAEPPGVPNSKKGKVLVQAYFSVPPWART